MRPYLKTKRGEKMHKPHGRPTGFRHRRVFMSVEEDVEMLEKAKEHLETQLKNVNERLEKLKA